MKKTVFYLLLVLITGLGVTGCKAEKVVPQVSGADYYQYITQTDDYKSWAMWPGKNELYPGTQPHGAFLTTYVNGIALKAIEQQAGTLPDGAIVVKENFSPDKKLAAITIMVKKSGYNPAAGDYFWVKYAPDGTVLKEGAPNGCIGCHTAVAENDWLFTGNLRKAKKSGYDY